MSDDRGRGRPQLLTRGTTEAQERVRERKDSGACSKTFTSKSFIRSAGSWPPQPPPKVIIAP